MWFVVEEKKKKKQWSSSSWTTSHSNISMKLLATNLRLWFSFCLSSFAFIHLALVFIPILFHAHDILIDLNWIIHRHSMSSVDYYYSTLYVWNGVWISFGVVVFECARSYYRYDGNNRFGWYSKSDPFAAMQTAKLKICSNWMRNIQVNVGVARILCVKEYSVFIYTYIFSSFHA